MTKVYMDISFNYTLTLVNLVFKGKLLLHMQPCYNYGKKSPKIYPETAVKCDEYARVAYV